MDARSFIGIEQSHNRFRWSMPIRRDLCTLGNFMFGGVGLGAAIAALEGTAGRNCVWATGQYLSYATVDEVMDIDVTIAVEGHQITQARAVGLVGDREILTVNAALGDRHGLPSGQWEHPGVVAAPEDCAERPSHLSGHGTITDRLEQRIVRYRPIESLDGTPGDGRTTVWARIPDVIDGVDATALAILGDFVPMAAGQALGILGGGNSLDNTLRVARLVPTEWVLLDISIHAAERGFAHGMVQMFAEDGTLLATASQSCILRFWKGDRLPVPSSK